MESKPWIVFDYEGNQLEAMCKLQQTGNATYKELDGGLKNAVVESALLHTRILVDILLSRGSDSDDIRLKDILPNFQSSKIAELRTIYGTRKEDDSPCWVLNKMLAHPTRLRSHEFDYTNLLNSLVPLIVALVVEVNAQRPLETKNPPSSE